MAIIRIARWWPVAGAAGAMADRSAVVNLSSDGLEAFGSESASPREALPTRGRIDTPDAPDAPEPAIVEPELTVAKPHDVDREAEGDPRAEIRAAGRGPKTRPAPKRPAFGPRATVVLGCAALAVASAGLTIAGLWQYQRMAGRSSTSWLLIDSTPAGVDVYVSGKAEGKTPLALTLPAGQYDVRLVAASGTTRDFRVALAAGASVVRHVELAPEPDAAVAAAPASGALHIQTDPARLAVSVDGVDRGHAPLTLRGLAPGDHQIAVRHERGTVRKKVTVLAGQTVSLVISQVESATAASGWLAISAPVTLQLHEGGRLIGTTETDRLMLPAGDHEIEFVNDELGFRTSRKVNVAPGKTTTAEVELPNGTLSLNALPWAEVWVDGERVGETPIANLSRRIGPHEVVFRHPQFGERRETVMVTARQPARLGLDMRRQ